MKIIHIAGGGDVGGAKPHILGLCARLSRKHSLKLISMRSGDFSDEAVAQGIDTTVFSGFVPADYAKLIRMIRREKPDIVHCHGAKANLAGILVKLFCRVPIVTTIHSDWRLDYMHSRFKELTIGRLNAACIKGFDYYTTVSDHFKTMMLERGFSPTGIMVIYNGIDFEDKTPCPHRAAYLRELGLDYQEGDVVIGIAVRLMPVKDVPTLLKAFAKARKDYARLKLLIGGDGEERSNLEALAQELNLGTSVCFAGWIDNPSAFFAACDIDVLCSISESFPYSVLEGIREGCALITSDVGGMNRLIDHGKDGYIFQPGDVDTFARYLAELGQNEDKRRQFAVELQNKASRLYSLDNMADTQTAIYSRILEINRRKKGRDGVVICGAYGKNNAGDEAILKAIIASMEELDDVMPITVMTRTPRQTQILHQVPTIYTFHILSFLRHIGKAKLFINGGGSLIQDATSSRSLYYYLFTIWAAKKRGCKVLMYGCGIGPVSRPFNRRLAKSVLDRNVDLITLRDTISFSELEALGITRPQVRAAADPALSLLPLHHSMADEYLRCQGIDPADPYLCFSIRPWKGFKNFHAFAHAADYAWETYRLKTLFLPIEPPLDKPPSQKAAALMKSPYVILDTPGDVNLTIAIMKKMRLVCAMRLHALVFAAAAGVPFIAAAYDIKVSSFMEYVNSPHCCQLEDLTGEWLCREIDKIMAQEGPQKDIVQRLALLEGENARAARDMLR